MDVRETSIAQVLNGGGRYLVPLYQRPYAWEKDQLRRLWDDVIQLADRRRSNRAARHFTGSLVLSTGAVVPGAIEFLVVDGQQRLTTISILLAALRDYVAANEPSGELIARELNEKYLIDAFRSGDERLKLLPTQIDRDAYRAVVDASSMSDVDSRIARAHQFFVSAIKAFDDPNDDTDIVSLRDAILHGLAFVSITAATEDNVYRIFESLNNTGLKLTQADLLRNYLFMRLGDLAEDTYNSWWLPMQRKFSQDELEVLFWIDLVGADPLARQGDMYSLQEARLRKLETADEVLDDIKRMSELSGRYERILHPELETSPRIAVRLSRMRAWGGGAADPLLVHLLTHLDTAMANVEQVERAIAIIESFIVRRLITGRSGSLSRIFMQSVSDMDATLPIDDALHHYLSVGRKYYATDEEVRRNVRGRAFYFSGRPQQRKLFLSWLEQTFESHEPVDLAQSSIEHVMPQTLTPEWRRELTVDVGDDETLEDVHEELLHTLGNLTLTGYNSEMSNRPFADKREQLGRSGIELSRDIAKHPTWGRPQILARADDLANRIIANWIPPVAVRDRITTDARWSLVDQAIDSVPPGSWTTYGALAAIAGSHPVPVGQYVASRNQGAAWRVLKGDGSVAAGFRWSDDSRFAGMDAREVLELEGVTFSDSGRADPSTRISATELADSLGLELAISDEKALDDERGDVFEAQLAAAAGADGAHGVLRLFDAWRELGGYVWYGRGLSEVSAGMELGSKYGPGKKPWPFTIYPRTGTVEVVFQHMASRPPFDSEELRREFWAQLTGIPGITIPADRLLRRPSFKLSILADLTVRDQVIKALAWFADVVAERHSD